MKLSCTVIICTKDRPQVLRDTLETVLAQSRRPEEILLVDDGNLDAAVFEHLLAGSGIPFCYHHKDQPGLAASRNLGVQQAHSEIILFLDDDVLLEPDYLAEIMFIFENDLEQQIGGATGALKFVYKPGVLTFLRFFGMDGGKPGEILPSGFGVLVRQGMIEGQCEVQWLAGCNMGYRREVFQEFQFDQGLGSYGWGEDRDFSFRVSRRWRLAATSAAKLVHRKEAGGRINARRFGFMETNYAYRFFKKNMPHRWFNWLAWSWAMVGVIVKNVLAVLLGSDRKNALDQLQGNLEGLLAIPSGKDRLL